MMRCNLSRTTRWMTMLIAAGMLSLAGAVRADTVIVDHNDDNDPATESPAWTLTQGPNTSVAAGSEVIGLNTHNYWTIDDNGNGSGHSAIYDYQLTEAELSLGWRVSADLRVVSAESSRTHVIQVDDGTHRWSAWITDDQIDAQPNTGFTNIESGLDLTADYNRVEIVYNAWSDKAVYLLNGSEIGTVLRSNTRDQTSGEQVRFGAGSSGGQGQVNWTNVEFAVITPDLNRNLAEHLADNNPTTEPTGWGLNQGSNTSVSGGSETTGSGNYDFWTTDDNGTGSGNFAIYDKALTPDDVAGPWRASALVRVVDSSSSPDLVFHVDDGTDRWQMWLFEDEIQTRDGVGTFVTIASGLDLTSDYNLIEMIFGEGHVTFLLNGAPIDYRARGDMENRSDAPQVRFGTGSSGGTGQANWASVQFAVIPEPATAVLAIAVAPLMIRRRRH